MPGFNSDRGTGLNQVPTTPQQVNYKDRSGTITAGGAAQSLAPANAARQGFYFQNLSTGDLWISFVGTAAASQPSIWCPAGSYYENPEAGVNLAAISVYGATTGQSFACAEW